MNQPPRVLIPPQLSGQNVLGLGVPSLGSRLSWVSLGSARIHRPWRKSEDPCLLLLVRLESQRDILPKPTKLPHVSAGM